MTARSDIMRMRSGTSARAQAGFTLLEAMVALTVGLILLTIMSLVFVANGSYRNDMDRSSRMVENASYSLERITGDAMMAAYYAELDLNQAKLTAPKSKPDPCSTLLTATTTADSITQMHQTAPEIASGSPLLLGVQGYDAPDNATAPTLPATCGTQGLTDLKLGSDVLVVRHTDPCVAGPTAGTGCDAAVTNSGIPYFQSSHCTPDGTHNGFGGALLLGAQELGNPGNATGTNGICASADHNWCVMATDTSQFILNNIDCNTGSATQVPYHRYLVDIYYVTNNDNVGSGACPSAGPSATIDCIPTLRLAQLGGTGGATAFSITPIAEGIETMQVEYGLDTTGDGIPDVYTADPDSYPGTASVACSANAQCIQNWMNVVSVKVHLLARNTELTPVGYTNDKTFTLGLNIAGTANTFGPFNDAYKRHVYEASARLYNPAGRRQTGPTP